MVPAFVLCYNISMRKAHHLQLDVIVGKLLTDFLVVAPTRLNGIARSAIVNSPREIDWSGALTANSWKEYFLPHREKLFTLPGGQAISRAAQRRPLACCGMHLKDLQALNLFDLAYKNDCHYQARRQAICVIGYGIDDPSAASAEAFREDDLEHVRFDLFIRRLTSGRTLFYAGSSKGEKLLKKYGIPEYTLIPFAGAVPEGGPDKRMLFLAERFQHAADHGLWDDLDKICLACGKCSNVCPTCFCFDLTDRNEAGQVTRERVRSSCFFSDFSLVAGGQRHLSTVKSKIFFWYEHKFVRIPKEYKVPGCVACGRCVAVCPAGINIFKNLGKIAKIKIQAKRKND